MALCSVVNCSASSCTGVNSWEMYSVNVYSIPMEITPSSTSALPPPRIIAIAITDRK